MMIPHDNPHHTLDVYSHCLEACKYLSSKTNDDDLDKASFFHDVGKPYVKSFVDSKGNPYPLSGITVNKFVNDFIKKE